MSTIVQTPNAEAIAAWDGPLYDRFVQVRQIITDGLGIHGEQALRLHRPRYGERVLDVGCGFGDTTQRLAALVGPDGEAVGIDAAARFIDTARREADEAGVGNARFEVADIQQAVPGTPCAIWDDDTALPTALRSPSSRLSGKEQPRHHPLRDGTDQTTACPG